MRFSGLETGSLIYLCFLFRTGRFCFWANHDFVRDRTKSACLTATEKHLSTTICPHNRWRSQSLSSVSRKQRYNTLDFPTENRVPTGMLLAPIGNLPTGMLLAPIGNPEPKVFPLWKSILSTETLFPTWNLYLNI